MGSEGPSSFSSERSGRGLDIAVWVLVVSALVGVAAAVAWFLSTSHFVIRTVTYSDEATSPVELIPVAPAPEPTATDPLVAREEDADGVAPPRWARQPAPFFPDRAARRGIDRGEVELVCEAYASGRVGACTVLSETPPGARFAEAALASMGDARVLPRRGDGVPTDSRIRFVIHFRLAPEL